MVWRLASFPSSPPSSPSTLSDHDSPQLSTMQNVGLVFHAGDMAYAGEPRLNVSLSYRVTS
jgi:hypothetical protein